MGFCCQERFYLLSKLSLTAKSQPAILTLKQQFHGALKRIICYQNIEPLYGGES